MVEPVTLEEIAQHLRIVADDEDAMVIAMGIAAREWVENYTGLTLARREVTEVFSSFEQLRTLSAWPIAADASPVVRYAASSGAALTIDGATVVSFLRPCPISPAAGTRWPLGAGPVAVTILAGPDAHEDVPASLKAAILLIVGNLYAHRETTVAGVTLADSGAIEMLCRPYRMPVIG